LLVLDSETQCSAGNSAHGISVKDVTGNNGGASDCWGAFEGNNSNAANPIQIGTSLFSELAKIDVGEAGAPDELSGSDIGLAMTGQGTASGTWSFNAGAVDGDFLVVLKAANKPGFGVWQFAGNPDNTSFSGSWLIAWTVGGGPDPSSPALSHISIYGTEATTTVPEPGTLATLGLGLLGLALGARRRTR